MNRPGDDNRITPVMVHEINDALDRAENDSEIRAFVLSAEAPVFCLGCDHYELRTLGSSDGRALELVEQVKILCERLERFPKPIIAAVNGNAKGGGFELRSEEHTSELQSLMRISYAVFCLKKKKKTHTRTQTHKIT